MVSDWKRQGADDILLINISGRDSVIRLYL